MRLLIPFLLLALATAGCRRTTGMAAIVGAYMASEGLMEGDLPAHSSLPPTITLVRDGTCMMVGLPDAWRADLAVPTAPVIAASGTWNIDESSMPHRVRLHLTKLNGVKLQSPPKSVFLHITEDSRHAGLALTISDGRVVHFRYFSELYPVSKNSPAAVQTSH